MLGGCFISLEVAAIILLREPSEEEMEEILADEDKSEEEKEKVSLDWLTGIYF